MSASWHGCRMTWVTSLSSLLRKISIRNHSSNREIRGADRSRKQASTRQTWHCSPVRVSRRPQLTLALWHGAFECPYETNEIIVKCVNVYRQAVGKSGLLSLPKNRSHQGWAAQNLLSAGRSDRPSYLTA